MFGILKEFVPHKNKYCIWSLSYDKEIYFMLAKAISLSALPASHSSRQLDSNTQPKMGDHTASENTFIAILKLVHLPFFKILNFSWTLTLPHTYIQPAGKHILHCYVLFSSQVYTYTHTYIYICK